MNLNIWNALQGGAHFFQEEPKRIFWTTWIPYHLMFGAWFLTLHLAPQWFIAYSAGCIFLFPFFLFQTFQKLRNTFEHQSNSANHFLSDTRSYLKEFLAMSPLLALLFAWQFCSIILLAPLVVKNQIFEHIYKLQEHLPTPYHLLYFIYQNYSTSDLIWFSLGFLVPMSFFSAFWLLSIGYRSPSVLDTLVHACVKTPQHLMLWFKWSFLSIFVIFFCILIPFVSLLVIPWLISSLFLFSYMIKEPFCNNASADFSSI